MSSDIRKDIDELIYAKEQKKEYEDREKTVRQRLLEIAQNATNISYLLPKKTLEIPPEFWLRVDMNPESFFLSRFPAWDILTREKAIDRDVEVWVLQRKPQYEGWIWEDEEVKVNKVVQEGTPIVDWETLDREFPNLKERISNREEKITYELDGDKLQAELANDPELFIKLERHLVPKEPTLVIRTSKKNANKK